MEIAQQLSLATCVHEAIWQHSDGKNFLSSLQKQSSSIDIFPNPKKSRSCNKYIIYDTFFFLYGLKAFWKERPGERKTVTSDEEIFFHFSEAQL